MQNSGGCSILSKIRRASVGKKEPGFGTIRIRVETEYEDGNPIIENHPNESIAFETIAAKQALASEKRTQHAADTVNRR